MTPELKRKSSDCFCDSCILIQKRLEEWEKEKLDLCQCNDCQDIIAPDLQVLKELKLIE